VKGVVLPFAVRLSRMINIVAILKKELREAQAKAHQLGEAIRVLEGLGHAPKRRGISAAGRKRIAAAQRKRWAKLRRGR